MSSGCFDHHRLPGAERQGDQEKLSANRLQLEIKLYLCRSGGKMSIGSNGSDLLLPLTGRFIADGGQSLQRANAGH